MVILGELILTESPLVIGPMAVTPPVCLVCYLSIDGRTKWGIIHILLHWIFLIIMKNLFLGVVDVDGQCVAVLAVHHRLTGQSAAWRSPEVIRCPSKSGLQQSHSLFMRL